MPDSDGTMWSMIHDARERLVRIEERSINQDEKIEDVAKDVASANKKIDEMHKFFLQAKGGAYVASAMTKAAWSMGGGLAIFAWSNWQAIKKFFGF